MPQEPRSTTFAEKRSARVAGWLCAFACVALGSFLRIHTALEDPGFDEANPVGMLKSDPGLLYYLTERVVASRGGIPPDFRADARIEHPELTDVPATFSVGQEFVAAWGALCFGRDVPLHVACTWLMGIWASLVALGVYGLTAELSGRALWGSLAAALYTAMPANYRTVGWILMNEDFSLPWFALHLWLAARAARVRTPASILLASLALGAAVSTWQATAFFVALETLCVFVWFLRTGRNPLATPHAWILPATLLALAAAVPVLRSTGFALSLPMQMLLALLVAAAWKGRSARLVAVAAWAAALALSLGWSRLSGRGIGEHAHVYALLWEKLRHLGQLPENASALPVETRLMWQGPFGTLDPWTGLQLLGLGALALLPATRAVARAVRDGARATRAGGAERAEDRWLLACGLALVSIPFAWLVERTIVLPGLVLPTVAAVAAARRLTHGAVGPALAGAVVCAQAWLCIHRLDARPNPWYQPPQRGREIAELVAAIPHRVPEGEAIAADFMTSTAVLAHTGHPIVFQPKWESRRSRARAVELFESFYRGTPEDLRRLLIGKYRCRYLAVDRAFFGIQRASWYVAGLPVGGALPGTCAEVLLSRDGSVLSSVPGYRLLYRSPASIRLGDEPSDFYRLFELIP